MKMIYKPEVIVVASSQFSNNADILAYTNRAEPNASPDLDFIPEVAGRVCYQSFKTPRPGGQRSYLENILKGGHGSVLEHSNVTLLIKGVSRSLTHELVRHRAGTAFSQVSQRFCEPETMGFIIPPLILGDPESITTFQRECEQSRASYDRLLVATTRVVSEEWLRINGDTQPNRESLTLIRKRAREAARALLPNCAETHIVMTGNLRAWRHIVELRGTIHADLEIRRLAVEIAKILKKLAPSIMQDVRIVRYSDGHESVEVSYSKV